MLPATVSLTAEEAALVDPETRRCRSKAMRAVRKGRRGVRPDTAAVGCCGPHLGAAVVNGNRATGDARADERNYIRVTCGALIIERHYFVAKH